MSQVCSLLFLFWVGSGIFGSLGVVKYNMTEYVSIKGMEVGVTIFYCSALYKSINTTAPSNKKQTLSI